MLLRITRHPKPIAWFFFVLFYMEWVLAPVPVLAAGNGNALYHPGYGVNDKHKTNPLLRAAVPAVQRAAKANAAIAAASPAPSLQRQQPDKPFTGGPGQPEMQAFSSVNSSNMVDLFSGDFSYNIPLLDVGGYPIGLSYKGGVSMDQEASWVGLGWNINPGTITRNMRGLPDDFEGKSDSVKKTMNIKENKTVGVTAGADFELLGVPKEGSGGKMDTAHVGNIGTSLGVFHNNYKGWGVEQGINASINSGKASKGPLTGGLSITNNTQEGLTISPSLSVRFATHAADEKIIGNVSLALPYNSRYGLKGLQFSTGVRQYHTDKDNQQHSAGSSWSTNISFSSPSFTPTMTIPLTNRQFSFTGKVGFEEKPSHPNFFLSGYVSKQRVDARDTLLVLPAFGYLHFQDGARNSNSLTDFNLEKEIPYREKPAIPNIAVPSYTYDVFSITGEGTGGMFRAYRGDIGFVNDHFIRSRDESDKLSIDVGIGDMVHVGVDLNVNRAFTQSGPWVDKNVMRNNIGFSGNNQAYEAVYFRNPGEKAINSKQFYTAVGGDDVVAVQLDQPGNNSSAISATGYLTRYRNKQKNGSVLLTPQSAVKSSRDKRTQVISYLTAKEANVAGLSKYIENYTPNQFSIANCNALLTENVEGNGKGLPAAYYRTNNLTGIPYNRVDPVINFNFGKDPPHDPNIPIVAPFTTGYPKDNYSTRWEGRIKAPNTGTYTMAVFVDDAVRLWVNDSLLINDWVGHRDKWDSIHLNLVAGEFYKFRMEYADFGGYARIHLFWRPPGGSVLMIIPQNNLYAPAVDTFKINNYVVKEKRVNTFRKATHISEIDVLNADGRRYVYGIPVYNLKQKEATFAVNGKDRGNRNTGFVKYTPGQDDNTKNQNGKDWYFNSEEVPAYAHSFLLTGIVSPDYVDVTANGISDDDLGDAVKFNYSKICGIGNPYSWRAPYMDSATFNEGFRTDYRDDKGNYVYGRKELWYLHSIESKTMVATFTLENRLDLNPIDEAGNKSGANPARRLKEINLYSKSDFLKKGTAARPIKTVHFDYSYELCKGMNKPVNDSGKLTLKKVWFTYNNNQKGRLNPYVFQYNSKNPSYNIKSYDRWGNYKDPLQNPGSTTGNLLRNDEYPYALQDSAVAAANAAAWTLDSISLPSGGAIRVDYESDDYAYVQHKRAAQMCRVIGLGSSATFPGSDSSRLYTSSAENLYVHIRVPSVVNSVQEVYNKYLHDLSKLYFRLSVKMPDDPYGTGYEYVPCYADLDPSGGYGRVSGNVIWVKLSGISLAGTEDGSYSPLAKAAIQFLRLNLPSKAYPGSEVGDNVDLSNAVKMVFSLAGNIITAFSSFDKIARNRSWATQIDTMRTWVRLNSPDYKKYGGGQRVKRVTVYDNWNKMVPGQRGAVYGQEYNYTTTTQANGNWLTISSGVASYEPGIGGDENPLHVPIEYVEKVAPLGPVTLGYNEEPLGESFFPGASVGYSKVRVKTINYQHKKSANGYSETQFYTAYDFPVYTDRSMLDGDTKKRYKPSLANFLRINARYHLVMSQGFKVELNDMHGKLRSEATYAETDPLHPVTYTENIYKVEDPAADSKHLSNTVQVMAPDGSVDTTAVIGKDVELMVAMREQLSITNAYNINVNGDLFSIPAVPPFTLLPSMLSLAQREENLFRSAAVTKIIQRYGIIDSVIHIDKGSKVSTRDVMYDSETGDAILTRTQNEFNDPVYNFSYPSHWAYDGMGLAYKNIGVELNNVVIKGGRLVSGTSVADSLLFSGGDEIMVGGRQKTGTGAGSCNDLYSTFPLYNKLWVIDSSLIRKGPKVFYFVDRDGKPYNGYGVSLKITRSGRRNQLGAVGSVTSLDSTVRKDSLGHYRLAMNTAAKVVNASAAEFKQLWKVDDQRRKGYSVSYHRDTLDHCNDTIPATYQPASVSTCFSPAKENSYSADGPYIFSSTSDHTGIAFDDDSGFWENPGNHTDGRLNRVGIWACDSCVGIECGPAETWLGFSKFIYIPKSDTVFIGLAGDNQVRVIIDQYDSIQVLQDPLYHTSDAAPFLKWYIYPKYLTQGYHSFTFQGWNYQHQASFGAEIYNLTRNQLVIGDTSLVVANTLFSTASAAGNEELFAGGYSCPLGYGLDTTIDTHLCIRRTPCPDVIDTIYASTCYSTVTDTTLNPYLAGILGNWRNGKGYTHFGRRLESDPSTQTDIRTNGTFNHFAPFWDFASGALQAQYDSTRWVWNSETTLFNPKGVEVENKDPLGRYNAGLYGYNLSMPTAVVQNARYRESAFDGFEDYGFVTQVCDTICAAAKHFDFTAYQSMLDTSVRHSGKYSLRLEAGQEAALGFAVADSTADTSSIRLTLATQTDACVNGGATSLLKHVKTDSAALLPSFYPSQGKRMVVSAWVRENQDCKCVSYSKNRIVITFSGGSPSSVVFHPWGSIIEGWQRYEGVFDIPPDARSMNVALESTDTATVNFDDVRIHPFNANMKSFVYNPSNLRLMAELDENNYASFYEYDDDGTLVRVKKETQRGIKTIKETRSALLK